MTSSEPTQGGLLGPLARALTAGRVSPAYLLEGSDPAGVRVAGLAFATALLCPQGRLRCDCRSCTRARAGEHRDLYRVRRDKPTVISVAALTPVLTRAHDRPVEGARQVFVVEPADALEAEGVARYLKTLEEPPEASVFVLLTSRPERLSDAVRSRCQRFHVPGLSEDEVRAALAEEGAEPGLAARAARAATGSLSRARRLLSQDVLQRVDELVEAARGRGPGVARAVESALSALRVAAAAAAPPEDSEPAGEDDAGPRDREALRALLHDVLHVVGVEACEAAAGRASFAGAGPAPAAALALLETSGVLGGATALNVNPSVVLTELARALDRALPR